MNLERIKELMVEADEERLSYGEIAEIEAAFNEVPDHFLSDLRDNASVIDMLIELESWTHFSAVLAKNYIAREIGEAVTSGEEPNYNFILEQLKDIEKYTGTLNQPSVQDSYENE